MLGISSEDDTDGNLAHNAPVEPPKPKTDYQQNLIEKGTELAKKMGWKGKTVKDNMTVIFGILFNKEKSADLTEQEASKAIDYMEGVIQGDLKYPPEK
jgi:ribosomal protein L4